jgi:F-box/TPR repeat protein Pof3
VEISTGNLLLTALDHRAAAYEKVDKLQAALRDSKQMIDLKPQLAKVLSEFQVLSSY